MIEELLLVLISFQVILSILRYILVLDSGDPSAVQQIKTELFKIDLNVR